MKTKTLTKCALLAATAIIFGYAESLLPAFSAIPGIKLGLSNIVILLALFRFGKAPAFFIMLIKVSVCALLFSGVNVFIYSLGGGILSLAAMIIFRRAGFGVIGISMLGGIFHNIGQLFSAALMLGSGAVFFYLPPLLLSGMIFGGITGAVCRAVLIRTDKFTS